MNREGCKSYSVPKCLGQRTQHNDPAQSSNLDYSIHTPVHKNTSKGRCLIQIEYYLSMPHKSQFMGVSKDCSFNLKAQLVCLKQSCVLPSACEFSSPIDAFNPDYKQYPKFRQAKAISFTQEAGDHFIIPTGWFHQVSRHIKINVVMYPLRTEVLRVYKVLQPEGSILCNHSAQLLHIIIIIHIKKLLDSNWLIRVQFTCNTSAKSLACIRANYTS